MIYPSSIKQVRTLFIVSLTLSSFFVNTNAFSDPVGCRFCALACAVKCVFYSDPRCTDDCTKSTCQHACSYLSEPERKKLVDEVNEEAKKNADQQAQ